MAGCRVEVCGLSHQLCCYAAESAWKHLVGLEALWEAQQCEGKEASECMQAAVEAMLEALKALPLAVGLLMESPLEHQQEHGVTSVSGWVATHISLEHNPRLRESLSHDGLAVATSPMSDFTTLCEQLPPATYTIWHEGKWRTLEELRTSIGAFIEHHGVDPGLNAHLSEASLRAAHQEIAQWGSRKTSLEEWSALQEASQRLDELAVRAGLSPRETEVLALQRQGFTQEQIGAQLHLPRGTVKTHAERGAEKMYKAARG